MRAKNNSFVIIITLATTVLVMAVLFPNVLRTTGTPRDDAANIYKGKCSICHGADGSGNTPMGKKLKLRDLRSADVQKQSDAQLFHIIKGGKGKMPAYEKSLNEEQIRELVAYIRELAKKR